MVRRTAALAASALALGVSGARAAERAIEYKGQFVFSYDVGFGSR